MVLWVFGLVQLGRRKLAQVIPPVDMASLLDVIEMTLELMELMMKDNWNSRIQEDVDSSRRQDHSLEIRVSCLEKARKGDHVALAQNLWAFLKLLETDRKPTWVHRLSLFCMFRWKSEVRCRWVRWVWDEMPHSDRSAISDPRTPYDSPKQRLIFKLSCLP